jgi:tetratricopeptide (TPR) repeat protein
MSYKLSSILFSVSLSFAMLQGPAFAVPGGSTGSDGMDKPAAASPKKIKCKRDETAKYMTYKGKKEWRCVKLKAGVLNDAELYQTARALADENEYEWALDHLRLITQQQDPEVLNYTGYSHRKAGRLETGIGYYKQSLALKPDYVQAREYLGEAFVLAGFDREAAEQLDAIKQICGTQCEAYKALSEFITLQQP